MKRVILIRHGATAGNLQGRYIGSTDQPLCEVGIAQAKAAAGLQADRIVVSPMLRARQTAQILFPDQTCLYLEDLRESHFGDFEGKTAEELAENEAYRSWVDGGCTGPVPNGESRDVFKNRVCAAFLQAMDAAEEGSTTAFVLHGGCIMAILERFSVPKSSFYDWQLPNCGRIEAQMDESGPALTVVSGENL